MTTYSFSGESGNTLTFDPNTDALQFGSSLDAADLEFEQNGADLTVRHGTSFVILAATSFSALVDANFIFDNGSVARFDTAGADVLSGSSGADFISIGEGGSDTVSGGDGNDRIYAGDAFGADDQITGGAGTDHVVVAGTTNVTLGANTLSGVEAVVALEGSDVTLTLHANTVSAGGFSYDGSEQTEADASNIDASAVTAGSVSLTGGGGDDTLTGGSQGDTLIGGAGADTIDGEGGNDVITGGQDGDTLTGGTGSDRFTFGFGIPRSESAPTAADTIDTITDFAGRGAAGGDLLDLPSFSGSLPLAFNADAASFTHLPIGSAGTQLPAELIGDGFADVVWQYNATENRNEIWVDANDDGQFSDLDMLIFLSNAGDGTAISILDFVDNFPVIRLTNGNDTYAGNILDNTIYALAGDDDVSGGGGHDTIFGGADNDELSGGAGNDLLRGEAGDDTLQGDGDHDVLVGGAGDDTLQGGSGDDDLYAAESFHSGDAPDAENTLGGGAGNDQMYGAEGIDTMLGGDDDDELHGSGGDDVLHGDGGSDHLFGDAGNDTIEGGSGADTIRGEAGSDVLTGGMGADIFDYAPTESIFAGSARDTITDFNPGEGDRLDLNTGFSGIFGSLPVVFRGELVGLTPAGGEFLGGGDIGTGFTQLWWTRVAGTTYLIGDIDDNRELGGDDFFIEFTGSSFGNQTQAPSAAMFVPDTFRAFVGTQGDDIPIDGTAGDDQIFGLGGNDTLNGHDGADQLIGAAGDDTLNGGIGGDNLSGGDGEDTLNGGDDGDVLTGGADDDILFGGAGHDNVNGGDGNDDLQGGADNDGLNGGAGDDTVAGDAGHDGLHGDTGIDELDGGEGDDTITGGQDSDTLVGGGGNDVLRAANGVVGGSSGDLAGDVNTLQGDAGDDTLWGAEGSDTLLGGADNDRLQGSGGQDFLTGGTGADIFDFEPLHSAFSAPDQVTDFNAGDNDKIDLGTQFSGGNWLNTPVVFRGELDSGFVYASGSALPGEDIGPGFIQMFWARVESGSKTVLIADLNDNRQLDSTDFVVEFTGSSFGGQNEDLSISDFVPNSFKVIVGTSGDDDGTIDGTPDDDRIYGVAGNDTIDGFAGADQIHGGLGNDSIDGGDGNDDLRGDAGNDTIDGGADNDQILGGDDNDTLLGGEGSDFILGEAGDDHVAGNEGNDSVAGNAGDDEVTGGNGNDTLWAADSNFFSSFGDATNAVNTLDGGAGDDDLRGAEGNDTLLGGDDDDILHGSHGNDTLDGGAGIDRLDGWIGNDTLTGGSEADTFLFDFSGMASGVDQITDFTQSEGDKIEIPLTYAGRPLVFRGELAGFTYETGAALPGSDIGQGFTQFWWARVVDGAETKTLLIGDLTDNGVLDGSDFVAEFTGSSFASQTAAITTGDFVPGTFTVVVGTSDADSLNGTADGDKIFAIGGNDTINGLSGNDDVFGGAGDDQIFGGDDHDTLRGEADDDIVHGDAGNDSVSGGAGDDTLEGGNDGDTLYAADFGTFSSSGDAVDSVNSLSGGSGNDTLYGAEGQDTLHGGADNDSLNGGGSADDLHGDDGQDSLGGDAGDDTLHGGAGADTLNGGVGQDTLTGGTEADLFELVNPSFSSVAAPDHVTDFNGAEGDRIVVQLASGRPAVFRGELAGFDYQLGSALPDDFGTGFTQFWWVRTGTGPETKTVLFSDWNDNFVLDADDFAVEFTGSSFGNQTLPITAADFASGYFVATVGTPGNDVHTIDGGAGNDVRYGIGGNDVIDGNGGSDEIHGGIGNDTISGNDDNDMVVGDAGDDTVSGNDGSDTVAGGAGNDTVNGGDGTDTLYAANIGVFSSFGDATTDANTLNGGAGDDLMYGAEGHDTLNGGLDDDQLEGAGGDDVLNGESGSDVLYGGEGNDILTGGSLDDDLDGGSGNDTASYSASTGVSVALDGSFAGTGNAEGDTFVSIENLTGSLTGADTLRGNSQNNVLRGQGGVDTLEGMGGDDVLRGGALGDTLDGGEGSDTADYSDTAGVTVALDGSLTATGDAFGDTFTDVENLTGSATGGDTLEGDGNANVISGLGGSDTLTLSGGADTVVYGANGGADTVTDFSLADVDQIDLTGIPGASILSGVMALATQDGADTLFNFGGGNTLRLTGISKTALNDEQYFDLADNSGPTNIGLAGNTVAEDAAVGAIVGSLSATDIDLGETFTYAVVSGSYFTIDGSNLVVAIGLDFETIPSHPIIVRVTDSANNQFDKEFTINVTNVNEDPTDIALSAATVAENSAAGTVVGALSASDPDAGETFTFSLVDNAGGRFAVSGSNLVVGAGELDYEQATFHNVTVRVTDSDNNSYDEVFTVSLTDLNGVTITGTGGNDTINATTTVAGQPLPTPEADTINGGNGNDNIQSLGGNDTVNGGGGDDTVEGGAGDDALNGAANGAGGDTVSYENATAGVTVSTAITTGQDTVGAGTDTLLGFEHLRGSNHNDSLTGSSIANTLSGLDGDDTLNGAQGNDTLDGGLGDDTLEGGSGDDTLTGGANNAGGDTASYESLGGTVGVTVTVGTAGAQNTGGAGLDTLSGIENLTGSSKADVLNGDGLANVLRGLDGDDTLNGNAGIDTLDGGAGNDLLAGGADNDTMTGGLGDDTYVLEGTDTVVEADAGGTDTIQSTTTFTLNTTPLQFVENLTLAGVAAINGTGNGLNNTLTGNEANNTLSGGNGDDTLEGGGGNDTLNGNGGSSDLASYAGAASAVTVSLAIAGAQDTIGAGIDTLATVEGLIGSAFGDTLTGTTNANTLRGLGGDDILSGGTGTDTLDGGEGNDRLEGGGGSDAMTGGAGNDIYIVDAAGDVVNETGATDGFDTVETSITFSLNVANSSRIEQLLLTGSGTITGTGNNIDNFITGNSGNNTLSGLGGDDVIEGGAGDDNMNGGLNGAMGDTVSYVNATAGVTAKLGIAGAQNTGGAGNDTISQFENLTGSSHADNLTGSGGNNTLMGLAGNDILNGGAGTDILYGDDGDDTYVLDVAADRAIENALSGGTDTVQSKVTFSLDSTDGQFIENLVLTGTAAINGTGNALDNALTGTSGNNTLLGLDGDDIITGAAGRDIMTGGAGEDEFVFAAVTDTGNTASLRDQITDFVRGDDLIDLAAIDAVTGGGDDQFSFIGTAAFNSVAGELRQSTSGGNTIISGDVDGNGVGDFQIQLNGLYTLDFTDFRL